MGWTWRRSAVLVLASGLAWWLAGCGAAPNLTSKPPVVTPTLTWPTPAPINYGTALTAAQLDATAGVPGSFAYSPALGTVLSGGSQKLTVTFTPDDTADYTPATAAVSIQVNPTTSTLTWPTPAQINYGTALTAAQLDATAGVPGSFAYSPALGTVLSGGSQKLTVTFTPDDTADYTPATAAVSIQVIPITPTLTWATPSAIVYGAALGSAQLDASSGGLAGTFSYSPSAGAIPGAGVDTVSVSFTPSDTSDYTIATAGVTLTVAKATPATSWTPAGAFASGMTLTVAQLDATANVAGSFLYSPAAGTYITSVGQQTLSAAFTPTDQADYKSVEANTTLDVLPFGVVAWGDSLTVGDQGDVDTGNYPAELAAMVSLPVVNDAVNANTPTQIGIREGGLPTTATVAGGTIPAVGGATVTFPVGWEPVSAKGPAGGIGGSILGVHGQVTFDPTSSLCTFTRTTPGQAVSAPGSPPFVVDTPYLSWIPVFWEGRNDIADPARTVSDIAAEVAVVPAGQTYIVLANINGNAPDEWIGGANYEYIVDLNNQLANIYGAHYLDIRQSLISNFDPTQATDVADVSHDDVPTSLRAVYTTATLVDPIGPTDTVLKIEQSSVALQIGAVLTIDTGANAENAYVSALTGDTVTVVRNLGGANVAHAAGALLTESNYFHLNAKGYQIVADAVAKVLSKYSSQARE